MAHYTQLQRDQLCRISALTDTGATAVFIAEQLGVCRSTIYREWARCGGRKHYAVDRAMQERAHARAGGANNARIYGQAAWDQVEASLRQAWSPDSISGRSRALPDQAAVALPSRSRIYMWAHERPASWWPHKRIRRYGPRSARPGVGRNGAPAGHWRARGQGFVEHAHPLAKR